MIWWDMIFRSLQFDGSINFISCICLHFCDPIRKYKVELMCLWLSLICIHWFISHFLSHIERDFQIIFSFLPGNVCMKLLHKQKQSKRDWKGKERRRISKETRFNVSNFIANFPTLNYKKRRRTAKKYFPCQTIALHSNDVPKPLENQVSLCCFVCFMLSDKRVKFQCH